VPTKRSYRDLCGIARALDAVGERWALLVVRELMLGPKRFTDLRTGLPNLGPDILSQRLRELEQVGVVGRRRLEPPSGAQVYELTDRGRELESVILALGDWGSSAPIPRDASGISVDSTILGMKTLFDPLAAGQLTARLELRLDEQRFRASILDGDFEIERGEQGSADARIKSNPLTFATLLWQGRSLVETERAGEVEIEGSRKAARGFLRAFPL